MNIAARRLMAVFALGSLIAIIGCSNNTPPLSKDEQKNFNPGPPGKDVDIAGYMKSHSAKGAPSGPGGQPTPATSAPASGIPGAAGQ